MKEITTYQNEIPKIFENTEFGKMRVITMEGDPWFIAKDVCEILSIKNSHDAVNRLDEDEIATSVIPTQFGDKEMNIINESGLYSLIMSSRKPEAKRFKKWVTSEVLPAIRKSGMYQTKAQLSPAEFLLQQAELIFEIDKHQRMMEEKIQSLQVAFDERDNIVIENDRQRLVQCVKEYAAVNGFQYGKAWTEFVKYYNNAYNTNLNALKTHLMKKLDLKTMTIPEYLEITDHLDDALRVAEKMLNQLDY